MTKSRNILVALALPFIFLPGASSQTVHCRVSPVNAYGNEYRIAILKTAGFITRNPDPADKSVTYIKKGALLAKPVSCKFSVDQFGQIENLAILKTSGDAVVDQAALALIRKAAPFNFEAHKAGVQIARFGPTSDVIVVSAEDDK